MGIVDRGLKNLTHIYSESISKVMLGSLLEEVQVLKDALGDLNDKRWLNSASGVQIDRNGEIVGISRPSVRGKKLEDRFFKVLTQAQVGINNSRATFDDIVNALALLFTVGNSANEEVTIYSLPGAVLIEFRGEIPKDLYSFLIERSASMVRAGVRVEDIVKLPPKENETFRLSSPNKVYGRLGGNLSGSIL